MFALATIPRLAKVHIWCIYCDVTIDDARCGFICDDTRLSVNSYGWFMNIRDRTNWWEVNEIAPVIDNDAIGCANVVGGVQFVSVYIASGSVGVLPNHVLGLTGKYLLRNGKVS